MKRACTAIEIVLGSAAVGLNMFLYWHVSSCKLDFVLGLYDVHVCSQGHVLFLTDKYNFSHSVLVV
jgi:hypothetical protein